MSRNISLSSLCFAVVFALEKRGDRKWWLQVCKVTGTRRRGIRQRVLTSYRAGCDYIVLRDVTVSLSYLQSTYAYLNLLATVAQPFLVYVIYFWASLCMCMCVRSHFRIRVWGCKLWECKNVSIHS